MREAFKAQHRLRHLIRIFWWNHKPRFGLPDEVSSRSIHGHNNRAPRSEISKGFTRNYEVVHLRMLEMDQENIRTGQEGRNDGGRLGFFKDHVSQSQFSSPRH